MSAVVEKPPLLASKLSAPTPKQALRRLFLTLFLRGRGARGLNQKSAPKSVASKLWLTLLFYGLFGLITVSMATQPVFALSIYLHAMTFAFLGMFVASSAGEILFNKEEADILMHRPIDSRDMLWSKIRVLIEISLWVAGAFNLAGLFIGLTAPDSNWFYPLVHAVSTALEALFCAGSVVLVYQLCLRWFGRERLDGLMTTTQVLISVVAVGCSQILPRIMFRYGHGLAVSEDTWWVGLLPPAWFAGFDDAFAGNSTLASWLYGGVAVIATGLVLWLAFIKLAQNYEAGLQVIAETTTKPKTRRGRSWVERLVSVPPMSWWLRDPVSRASFLLITAYLARDRDVKLRVYPGIAPMLIIPFVFLFQKGGAGDGFGIAFSGGYIGIIPLLGLNILKYSQQWQAGDIFRMAPVLGPASICDGARRAVLFFLTLPMLLAIAVIIIAMQGLNAKVLLLLPGMIAIPVYSLVPAFIGRAVPLSSPIEEGKSASRGLSMILVTFLSLGLSLFAYFTWRQHWFWYFLAAETIVALGLYLAMRHALSHLRWSSAE